MVNYCELWHNLYQRTADLNSPNQLLSYLNDVNQLWAIMVNSAPTHQLKPQNPLKTAKHGQIVQVWSILSLGKVFFTRKSLNMGISVNLGHETNECHIYMMSSV